jgi:hypothetical protein
LQKFTQVFLLALIIIASTPKKFLHDIIIEHDHCHATKRTSSLNQEQIEKTAFKCDIDNLVVDVPFIYTTNLCFPFSTYEFEQLTATSIHSYSKESKLQFLLRGPPATS